MTRRRISETLSTASSSDGGGSRAGRRRRRLDRRDAPRFWQALRIRGWSWSGTTGRWGLRRRSTAGSTSRADAGSRGSTPTTSRSRVVSNVNWRRSHENRPRCSAAVSRTSTHAASSCACIPSPTADAAMRWHALFSSPFYHPTVLVDRHVLDRHGLRYDTTFARARTTTSGRGCSRSATATNLDEPLVLYRVHAGQASQRRRKLQRELQRRVAFRGISRLAPELSGTDADLAWRVGVGEPIPRERLGDALDASRPSSAPSSAPIPAARAARRAAAWSLARMARNGRESRAASLSAALRLDPALAAACRRRGRAARGRRASGARDCDGSGAAPTRPADDRPPGADAVPDRHARPARRPAGARPHGRSTPEARSSAGPGTVQLRHRAVFVEGRRVPGAHRVLRHDYPLSFGVFRALRESRPEVVVLSGWSTFASQAAVAWCRRRHVPYVLLVESNERDARPGWRRTVKGAVVPAVVRGAAEVLVVGTLARESMLARGVDAGADLDRREHRRRRPLRPGGGRSSPNAATSSGPSSASPPTTSPCSRSRGSLRRRGSTRSCAPSRPPRIRGSCSCSLARAPSGSASRRWRRSSGSGSSCCRTSRGNGSSSATSRPTSSRSSLATSRGASSSTRRRRAGCRSSSPIASARLSTCSRTVATACSCPPRTSRRRRPRSALLAADPERRRAMGAASRELVGGWGYEPSIENLVRVVAACRRPSGRERLRVDRELASTTASQVDRRAARRAPCARRERSASSDSTRATASTVASWSYGTTSASPSRERRRDAGPVGDDHGRPDRRGLRRDEPEVLAAGGEHEDVGAPVEVVRRSRRRREQVDATRGRGVGRSPRRTAAIVPCRSSGPTRTTCASGSLRAASRRCSTPFSAAIRPT